MSANEKYSIWGIRNPNSKYHWQEINLADYESQKPIVVCLSGNTTTDTKDANGLCKIAKNLLVSNFKNLDDDSQIYQNCDFLGVAYQKNAELNNNGTLTKEDRLNFVDNILMPLCVLKKDGCVDIQKSKKNLSRIMFFTYCHGSKETFEIISTFSDKLSNKYKVNYDDFIEMCSGMNEISYAPSIEFSFIPKVSILSSKDKKFGCNLFDYDFGKDNVSIKFKSKDKYHDFDNIDINVKSLINQKGASIDEHAIKNVSDILYWNDPEYLRHNADPVTKMISYTLGKNFACALENVKTSNYIPKPTNLELKSKFDEINQYTKDNISIEK